jgi:two-component system, LytTR family, response regulator
MEQNTYSCLIVDDEPLAQAVLETFVGRLPFLRLQGKANHAIEALSLIRQNPPDIVFLDVTMPEMSGFELLQTLTGVRPQVIMTTAHTELAVEGFAYDVTDYLVKPILYDRFVRAVNRAVDRIGGKKAPAEPESKASTTSSFWIKEGTRLIQVNIDDVVYVEGLRDYVKIHLATETLVSYLTMARMEQMLPQSQFIRINRSYLVRKRAIKIITGNALETTNGQELTIGASYRPAVIEYLKDSFIGRSTPE